MIQFYNTYSIQRVKFLLLALLTICGINSAQSQNNTFRSIYLNKPELFNECLDIEKGDNGFLWITNSDGVIRYDGYTVRKYHYEYNFLRSIHKLSDGSIITLNNFQPLDVRRYNPYQDKFIPIEINCPTIPTGAISDCGAVDEENNLWVGTSKGILCYQGDNNSWIHFKELQDQEIKTIVSAGKMLIIITSTNLLHVVSVDMASKRLNIERTSALPYSNETQSTLYDPFSRSIHLGTLEEGLYSYNISSGDFTKRSNLQLDNIPIKALTELDDELILIGTDGLGVLKVRRSDFSIVDHYCRTTPYEYPIISNAIYDIYVDDQKRIYAATYAHGVLVLDSSSLDYKLIAPRGVHGEPLLSTVNALYEDSDGTLMMGTNTGIYTISKDGKEHNLYSFDKQTANRNKVILTINSYNDEIYAGGYGSGLIKVDKRSNKLRPLYHNNSNDNSRFLFALHNDNDATLWLGGIDSKLMSYNSKNEELRSYGDNKGVSTIAPFNATKLIYSADYNLFIMDKISQEVTPFILDSDIVKQIGVEPKVHIIRKHDDIIYFATNNCGLISYNTATAVTTSHAKMLGEDYSNILSFEVDLRGDIWLATSHGIAYLNMQDNYAKCYEQLGSIKAGSYIKGASLLTRSGEVLFGTLEGALAINPNSCHRKSKSVPAPQIVDFKISYNSILNDTTLLSLKQPLSKIKELELSYPQNTFSLYFTQIDFSRFENTPYSWKLDGFDEQWSPISTRTFAEYRNVPPGSYDFKIRAYLSQNSDEYIESNIKIVVNNPWYWSWYMVSIYILLIIASMTGALYLYSQNLRRRQTQERIDNYIDTLHSLQTPLTLIKAPMECLNREVEGNTPSAHMLSIVSKNIDRLDSLISNQTNFFSLMEEATELKELSLNDYFRDLNDNFWEYALLNNVTINLEMKQPNKLVYISREALDKIMDNLLSNAIKYSDKGESIYITTDYNDTHWSVQILNRGVSIPVAEQKRVFKQPYRAENKINSLHPSSGMGLLLTHKLIQEMGATISFVSSEKSGTTFTLRVPMNISPERIEALAKLDEMEHNAPIEQQYVVIIGEIEGLQQTLKLHTNEFNYILIDSSTELFNIETTKSIALIIIDATTTLPERLELCKILKNDARFALARIVIITDDNSSSELLITPEYHLSDVINRSENSIAQTAERVSRLLISSPAAEYNTISTIESVDSHTQEDKLFIEQVSGIIRCNLANQDFNIDTLCSDLYMSRSAFYNKMKKITNLTPNEMLRRARMEAAAELLQSGEHSVQSVSDMVGFSDAKYFSKVFYKFYNCPPSKYPLSK